MATKITTLANGIKVATRQNGVGAARVALFSGNGSAAEKVGHVGKMNLFSNCINASGTGASAATTRSHTEIRAQAADANAALSKITAGISSDFSKCLAAAQAASDAQAVAMDKDHWALSKEYAMRTGFQGEALGEPVTGDSNTIFNTSAAEVADKAATLNRNGMCAVAIGNVDHDAFAAAVDKQFSGLYQGYSSILGEEQPQLFTGSHMTHRFDSMGYAIVTLMQHAVPAGHGDFHALRVANEIMGSWDNTQQYTEHSPLNLARRFTRRPELCSRFAAFYDCFPANGVAGITFRTEGGADEPIEAQIRIQNFMATRNRRTTDFEVVAAKNRILMREAMADQNDPVGYLGKSVLSTGGAGGVKSLSAQMGQMNAAQVKKAFDHWQYDQEIAVGSIGCTDGTNQTFSSRALTAHQQLV